MLKRKSQESLMMSDSSEKKRVRLENISQDVLTVKDLCHLIQYAALRHTHSVMKPSWFSVRGDDRVSRVNVMILDGLTQTHFYRYFTHFKHLNNKYTSRWTLVPFSGDLMSDLLNSDIVPSEGHTKIPAQMMWNPVIQRFGLKSSGLSSFLLNEQEMIKHNFPVKGGRGCEGFVCTRSAGHRVTDSSPLFGLDCEMCLTHAGLELTRVCVVDSSGTCVLDELVKPSNPIINYNTRFSGITSSMLKPVSTQLRDVQSEILRLLPPDAVLVGHSLENDLRALHLIHLHVVDTSLLYRREFGRFKLKRLAEVILKREIQSEERTGHDPCEDALAALHLAQYFMSKGPRKVVEDHLKDLWEVEISSDHTHHHSSSLDFGHALYRSGKSALFLSRAAHVRDLLSNQLCRRQYCSTDREVVCVFRRVVQSYSLSVLQFSYSEVPQQTPATRQHLQQMTQCLREMCVLYVGPLPSETTEKQLHKLFRRCGGVQTVRFLHNKHGVHAEVLFDHLEGAQLAVDHLNGHQISDCHIKVRRPVHESSLDLDERVSERQCDILNRHMIYVGNLSSKRHHHDDLLQTFKQFGPIQHITKPAKHAGKHSRHAFIKFERSESTQAAVGVALQTGNRKLLVCQALTPPHMASWTHTQTVAMETSQETAIQRCDQELQIEHHMKKLDGKVGKVFRALDKNCLSVVILPGIRSGAVDYFGLCFIHIKHHDIM